MVGGRTGPGGGTLMEDGGGGGAKTNVGKGGGGNPAPEEREPGPAMSSTPFSVCAFHAAHDLGPCEGGGDMLPSLSLLPRPTGSDDLLVSSENVSKKLLLEPVGLLF